MILEFDHKLSTVLPGQLLIGAEHSARDEAKLASEGVTAIVNCAGMICANHFPHRFHYLKHALAAVLVFIGSKIFVSDFLLDEGKFPPVVSLAVTFGLIAAGIAWSLWKTRDAATHR